MVNDLNLDELERLHGEATPGSVRIERRDDDDGSIDHIIYAGRGDVAACFETANANSRANAAFIEAAWNAFPALLALARRAAKAEGELADMRPASYRYEALVMACGKARSSVCICGCHISFVSDPTPEEAEAAKHACIDAIGDRMNELTARAEKAEADRDTLRAELDRVTKERDGLRKHLPLALRALKMATDDPGFRKNFGGLDDTERLAIEALRKAAEQ